MKKERDYFSLSETDRSKWTNTFVPEPFREMHLRDYPATTSQHQAALQAAQDYVSATRAGTRRPFVVFGRQGSGKTMLASCMWNELAANIPDRGLYENAKAAGTAANVAFVNCAQLVPWFRKDSDDRSMTPAQKRYHVGSCYLAVLDDLDKFPAGEWGNDLFQLVDSRLWSSRCPTVITMNLEPAALARRYGEAGRSIVDRFVRAGGIFVRLDDRLPAFHRDAQHDTQATRPAGATEPDRLRKV